jgi:replicative DNA helicase
MSESAEQQLIGRILCNPSDILGCAEIVSPDDFFSEIHKKAFAEMLALNSAGYPIDVFTVGEAMPAHMDYLGELSINTGGCNAEAYAVIVEADGFRRKAQSSVAEAQRLLAEGKDIESDTTDIQRIFATIERSAPECKTTKEMLAESISDLQGRSEGTIQSRHIRTGIQSVDERWLSILPTDLIVIPARPSMGKTAFMLKLVLVNLLDHPEESIIVFSLEMPGKALINRMLCAMAGIPLSAFQRGNLSPQQWAALAESTNTFKLFSHRLIIDDRRELTRSQISARVRKEGKKRKIRATLIDYFQLIRPEKKEDFYMALNDTSTSMKTLAADSLAPVVLLAQVHSSVEKRPDKRPLPGDIFGSDQLYKDCDIFTTIYRDEVYNDKTSSPGVLEFGTRKMREGETGTDYAKAELWKAQINNMEETKPIDLGESFRYS